MVVRETNEFWIVPCYACGSHFIPRDGRWTFNGDYIKPTFSPSMNETVNWPDSKYYQPEHASRRCHFIIHEGFITYCGDCTHELAGQTLELSS